MKHKRSPKKILKDKTWAMLSKYIRLKARDKDGFVECYTCGKKIFWKDAQAGHALGGRTNNRLFDEEIIRPQCYACNVMKHGNYEEFITKLIRENGLDWWERKLANSKIAKKFTKEELENLYEDYKIKVEKLLKKEET